MAIDFASMTTLVNERLQSSGTIDYPTAEVKNAIQYGLAEFSKYRPHQVGILFKLEGRKGTATSTSTDNLVDTIEGSFLAADATNEKVIHNTTDYTWAVVLSQSSTSQIGLSSDIMAINEDYEIYNKRCTNAKQLYIGDVPNNSQVLSAEYPIGTKRNFKRDGDILEIDIAAVPNTNSNTAKISNVANSDVKVTFGVPHALPNLTDWTATLTATAAVGATSLAATALQSAGTIDTGTEFNVENHRTTYVINNSVTIASSAATLTFYPPLEANVSSTAWVVTFRKTSLDPHYEDLVADLAAGRARVVRAGEFLNSVNIGGGNTYQNFYSIGTAKLNDALTRLKKSVPPKTSRRFPVSIY